MVKIRPTILESLLYNPYIKEKYINKTDEIDIALKQRLIANCLYTIVSYKIIQFLICEMYAVIVLFSFYSYS